jgi:hypothetical protein
MSDGSIKPSVGSIKTTRSAISKVTGETQPGIDKDAQNLSLFKDSSKLAALRPGSLAEEINNQKKDSENSENKNDKGEIAKSDQNDSRTYTNSRETENQAIINRIWGKNGALTGLKSNNIKGAADIGSYTSFSGGSSLASAGATGLSSGSGKGGAGLTSSSATSLDAGGSNGIALTRTGGSTERGSGATQSNTSNSRQFIDKQGNVINIDDKDNIIDRRGNPNDNSIRKNPEKFNHDQGGKDPYEQNKRIEPDHKPTGTGVKLESYKSKMSEEDQKLYDKLSLLVKVYRNDSVGFDTDLRQASTSREADLDKREQAIAVLVDTIKKESPEVQEGIINKLQDWGKDEKNGAMQIFLSEKLSFGMNKSVGGFVISAEGIGSKMALPLDLSDYTHTDIARHEGVHWKDVLSDGKLDGLVAGENKQIQELMLSAMRKFEKGEYDKEKIEKLDIGNLRYGSGYTRKLDSEGEGRKLNSDDLMGSNLTLALAEARAVLEQEFADKPEEFKAIGEEFAELALNWDGKVAKYDPKSKGNDESNVVKDGKEDGTNSV